MRLRKKWWAKDALLDTEICFLDGRPLKSKWHCDVFQNQNDIFLELGCGRGSFISTMATKNPQKNFIGVDIEMNAMVEIIKKHRASKKEYPNLRLLVYNIECIEEVFQADEISGIFINFCNPWPKSSQHKRRLTHPRQLIQYQKFLKKDGTLELKTDDTALYESSLEYLTDCGFQIEEAIPDLGLGANPYGIVTEYETKWRAKNIPIKYIKARLTEPAKIPVLKYNLKDRPKSQEIYLAENRI